MARIVKMAMMNRMDRIEWMNRIDRIIRMVRCQRMEKYIKGNNVTTRYLYNNHVAINYTNYTDPRIESH